MKFLKEWLIEDYLDSDNQFFDYKTQDVNGKDIFDLSKTGMSYYDNFLNSEDLKYMQKEKNLTGHIEYMRPGDYFNYTGKMFNRSGIQDYNNTIANKDNIEYLKQVILKYKRKFPLPYLNFADMTQEGRHRMAVAAELFGWNEKFPVLVVTRYA